jgi:hypothetical protein
MEDEKWAVIGRGRVGWHAKAASCSSSGGTLETYVSAAADGALVYDAEKANVKSFIDVVMNGPTVEPSLPPGEVDRFSAADRAAAAQMLPGLSGGYDTLIQTALADESWTGLDRVAVDVYETILAKVPGIRIGHVRDGKVEWSNK